MSYNERGRWVNEVFSRAYENADGELPFKIEWSNGAGAYDFAVHGQHAPKIPTGKTFRSITAGGRRLLFVGTRLGNLIVYDQFAQQRPGEEGYNKAVFCFNSVSLIEKGGWFHANSLDEFEMSVAVGDNERPNLGATLDQVWSAMKRNDLKVVDSGTAIAA